jgi:hypothetical protein
MESASFRVAHPSEVLRRSLAHRTRVDSSQCTPGSRTDHVSITLRPYGCKRTEGPNFAY